MQKSKTLIYSPSFNIWGGGQIYIEQLCEFMNANSAPSYVITSEPHTFKCKTKQMINTSSRFKRLIVALHIAKKYKKIGFKVIILNDLSSIWLAPVFKLYGFKTIGLLHLFLQKKSENDLGHSTLEYHLIKFTAKFCNKIFSVNKNNITVFNKRNTEFIGNYVPNWFISAPKDNHIGQYDFLIVSRFAKVKNIPFFINILANLIKRKGRQYSALIVGNGPEKGNINNMIFKYGLTENINFHDWVDRKSLPNIFDQGKCFVISSVHEGFATTVLEAHARGIPAVVTKSAGFCAEFVDGFNAKTGITFTPDDIDNDAFYDKLSELIENHQSYYYDCIEKASVFSEENVLGPILKSVLALSQNSK